MKIAISSGHGAKIEGMTCPQLNFYEHDEAVKVVDRVVEYLRTMDDVEVVSFEDTTSTEKQQNLEWLVDHHNISFGGRGHDLDCSVHFNSTPGAHGTECWYHSNNDSMRDLSTEIASNIAISSGLTDRGAKPTTEFYFLNHTDESAVLIEVCFGDSSGDVDLYRRHFDAICAAIATALSGEQVIEEPPPGVEIPPSEEIEPSEDALFYAKGPCSWFGGPDDTGVSASEGLAFIYDYDTNPSLFLIEQPPATSGLARRLNPAVYFFACRFDYQITPKAMLANPDIMGLVRANDREFLAWPADWGPHEDTDRVADLSLGLMQALCLETDDLVEVIYPAPE